MKRKKTKDKVEGLVIKDLIPGDFACGALISVSKDGDLVIHYPIQGKVIRLGNCQIVCSSVEIPKIKEYRTSIYHNVDIRVKLDIRARTMIVNNDDNFKP